MAVFGMYAERKQRRFAERAMEDLGIRQRWLTSPCVSFLEVKNVVWRPLAPWRNAHNSFLPTSFLGNLDDDNAAAVMRTVWDAIDQRWQP